MQRARETFHIFTAKGMRTVAGGAELSDDDPLVRDREHLFEHVSDAETPEPKPKPRRKPGPKPKNED